MNSVEFERRVERILRQLVHAGAKVLWNDRIPDPDNPGQLRQIDITIERDGVKTHIECRNHKTPQDTPWIEELIGRRQSLGATGMMAVSNSGYTTGAVKKAERYGVFLHELTRLSDAEIASWGQQSTVRFSYFGFQELAFQLVFEELPACGLEPIAEELTRNRSNIDAIMNPLRYRLNQDFRDFNYPYCFNVDAEAYNMQLLGKKVLGARMRGAVYLLKHKLTLPTIWTFRRTSHQAAALAHIEAARAGNTEIIKAGTRAYIQIDMSSAPKPPANAISAGVIEVDLNQPTGIPDFKIIGSPEHQVDIWQADLSIAEGW